MWCTPENRYWTVLGPAGALELMAPLIEVRRRLGPVRLIDQTVAHFDPRAWWIEEAVAALIIGDCDAPPETTLPGVFLATAKGRRVPVGSLPYDRERLGVYAEAAACVAHREAERMPTGPLILLGQWEDRTFEAAERVSRRVRIPLFRWTAERVVRATLCEVFRHGFGAALYLGHGLPFGWVGYGGIRARDLAFERREPIGVVLSITCGVARRSGGFMSFCEELVLSGVCAAALGSIGPVLHEENVSMAESLGAGMDGSTRCLADVLLAANAPAGLLGHYRILGDPLASLAGAPNACDRAREVFAPAPDDPLPIIPLESSSAARSCF